MIVLVIVFEKKELLFDSKVCDSAKIPGEQILHKLWQSLHTICYESFQKQNQMKTKLRLYNKNSMQTKEISQKLTQKQYKHN